MKISNFPWKLVGDMLSGGIMCVLFVIWFCDSGGYEPIIGVVGASYAIISSFVQLIFQIREHKFDNQLIIFDTFDGRLGWPIFNEGNASGEINNGKYRAKLKTSNKVHWFPNKGVIVDDFHLRVKTYCISRSEEEISYGVSFRNGENGGKYYFGISNFGRFEFVVEDVPINSIQWKSHRAINPNGKNVLEVKAVGSNIQLFVNNVKVAEQTDRNYSSGYIEMYVSTFGGGNEAIIDFDDLMVRQL